MPKGVPNQRYTGEFKQRVVETMRQEGLLYLSPILDLCSRDIVSYLISDKPVLSMVTEMLDKAFMKIPVKSELLYLQEFKSMEHLKKELVDYLDYYNNRRGKAKLKGLPPALHRQQALSSSRLIKIFV